MSFTLQHLMAFTTSMHCFALINKKAVLCEKALALNSRQVKEMIEASRANKVFLMEAFWTKFLPQYQKVTELIKRGDIGKLKIDSGRLWFPRRTADTSAII